MCIALRRVLLMVHWPKTLKTTAQRSIRHVGVRQLALPANAKIKSVEKFRCFAGSHRVLAR
jgi:hypothetical protein